MEALVASVRTMALVGWEMVASTASLNKSNEVEFVMDERSRVDITNVDDPVEPVEFKHT